MQKQETEQLQQQTSSSTNPLHTIHILTKDKLKVENSSTNKNLSTEKIKRQEEIKTQRKKTNKYDIKKLESEDQLRNAQQEKNISLQKQIDGGLQLQIEYQYQQFNLKQENKVQQAQNQKKKSNSMLICIQDSQNIPDVYLQSSPKGQKFISIKIPMYRTTTFMKMETQIFILDIKKPGSLREYQVQRRYSDFVDLYQSLFYNQPGYILAPFPDKGVQSFIKIKLGIGTNEPGQRQQMIEKRMLDLQKFINFITHHQELSNSQQLVNFITQDQSVFEQGKKRLQKYVSENRSLEKSSQIKNIIGIGKNLWSSYFKNSPKEEKKSPSTMSIGKNDIQFGIILQTVRTQKQKTLQKFYQFQKMYVAQKSFSQFVDLPTQNDLLLKLCAKHSSGKQQCKAFASFIQIKVLEQYRYNIRQFEEVEKSLFYRIQIWECLSEAKKEGNVGKKQKLSRRLEMFQRNFLVNWENIFVSIQKSNKKIYQKFMSQWEKHKKFMKKIWRI